MFQLLPEQAAIRINNALKLSNHSKSPKAFPGFRVPGQESYPENSNAVKM